MGTAQTELIESAMKLASALARARARRRPDLDADDLTGEAMLALCKAAQAYAPERGEWPRFCFYRIHFHLLGVKPDRVRLHGLTRCDAPVVDEEHGPDLDALPAAPRPDTVDLPRLLAGLDTRSRRIVRAVHLAGKSRAAVGRELGLSRERVRQLLVLALDEMRRAAGVGARS
jgi:DNA-directed RNA polymerase sigma subunit (sigma70/sigma32)